MQKHVEKVLGLKKTSFTPHHKNNLGNEFAAYANYELFKKCSK